MVQEEGMERIIGIWSMRYKYLDNLIPREECL